MLLIFASYILIAEILFAASLIVLMASIAVSMYEVFISIGALKLELEKVDRL